MVESYDSRTTILRQPQRRVGLHDLRIVSTLDGYIHDPLLLRDAMLARHAVAQCMSD